jgi:hypothetical protein
MHMKISLLLVRFATVFRFSMWACWRKHVYIRLCQYIRLYTSIYKYIPLGLGTSSCPNCPTALSRGPCVECCGPSRNSTWPFHRSCRAGIAGECRADQLPSGAIREGRISEYGTGEWKCSSPCTESVLPPPRYWDQTHAASDEDWSLAWPCRLLR